jgi:peptide/nickel transport system permease protein
MIGAGLVLFWIVMAVIAPWLPLYDPLESIQVMAPPLSSAPDGGTFWLGTDNRGRDVLSRVIWGSQRVLIWASIAIACAYAVGIVMGVLAGYLGGWVDDALSFVSNILISFPVLVLYVLIISFLGASGANIVIAVTFTTAPIIMRIVRGLIMDLRTRDYVAAAQTRGESSWYIMFIELLPNARGPLIVDACLRFGYTVVAIATLSFLGLGLPPPTPDWGLMIKEAVPMGSHAGHAMVAPAVALSTLILGFNMMADGLREISMRD